MKGLVTEQQIDAGVRYVERRAVAADQLHRHALTRRLFAAEVQAVRVGINTDQALGSKGLTQILERLALAATGIQQHRVAWQRVAEQPAQVIDRHPQHMVLPGVAAQEPETESGLFDVVAAQVTHVASLAQICEITFNRRFASLTNGLRSSQA